MRVDTLTAINWVSFICKRSRPTYSPEFRLEVAQEIVDQGRSSRDLTDNLGLGKSSVDKWARQLKQEPGGTLSSATPIRSEQQKIALSIHELSRGSAGARTIAGRLTQGGESVGRHKAASLMSDAGLVSKQANKHKYKIAEVNRK